MIATFGPETALAGQVITREGDRFVLEGHGSLTPEEIMEHDYRGDLVWASDGTRAWVGSKVRSRPSSAPSGTPNAPVAASRADDAGPPAPDAGQVDLLRRGARSDPALAKRALIPAVATTAIIWLGTFLLGLIPIHQLGVALLSPAIQRDDGPDNHWWAAWSLLCHFGGSVWIRRGSPLGDVANPDTLTYSVNVSSLLALLVLVGVVFLVGLYVRRTMDVTWQARLVAVVATALVMAVVAALVAVLGGESIGASSLTNGTSFLSGILDGGFRSGDCRFRRGEQLHQSVRDDVRVLGVRLRTGPLAARAARRRSQERSELRGASGARRRVVRPLPHRLEGGRHRRGELLGPRRLGDGGHHHVRGRHVRLARGRARLRPALVRDAGHDRAGRHRPSPRGQLRLRLH